MLFEPMAQTAWCVRMDWQRSADGKRFGPSNPPYVTAITSNSYKAIAWLLDLHSVNRF
ncbi:MULTISPECIES: hypothetical protein [unclassified Moorena]|uniref:hypothetical protein n=1 Tax=unclassified Moorena TaxID=2683338 RepID=UPI0013B88717|nr:MULTISPECIES: hypothetical protein [unclassified Moorena]NEQ17907.1 hypothetical protein [Moorena sp. SIO3E2]NER85523.1 hypothetical protein [Moorena sp. SIO3A2]NES45358.1 hypothetical protein [Moorena sp. SIO2C4]